MNISQITESVFAWTKLSRIEPVVRVDELEPVQEWWWESNLFTGGGGMAQSYGLSCLWEPG